MNHALLTSGVLGAAVSCLLLAPLPAQNEILYYKFESLGGSKVINYAPASSPAPREGTIVGTNAQAWAPGAFGSGALKGAETTNSHNYVDSGWTGPLNGSWTVAWFMKERTPLPNTLAYYLFSGIGSFRAFTSGAGGQGLFVGGWGGNDLKLTADIRTPAATRWVHVALVVDATALTATYYVDGVAQPAITITQGANVAAGTTAFRVGMHTRLTTGTFWDLDEFRLLNRAASAAQVMAWASSDLAAEAAFGKDCGARLAGSGTTPLPQLGNAAYALAVTGPAGSPYALGVGVSRLQLGAVPLPFDLGVVIPALAGCNWESGALLFLSGAVGGTGTAQVPLPIPNDPTLGGAVVYSQLLFLAPQPATSNPHASAVGN